LGLPAGMEIRRRNGRLDAHAASGGRARPHPPRGTHQGKLSMGVSRVPSSKDPVAVDREAVPPHDRYVVFALNAFGLCGCAGRAGREPGPAHPWSAYTPAGAHVLAAYRTYPCRRRQAPSDTLPKPPPEQRVSCTSGISLTVQHTRL
jgi:hypothetical protein